LIETQGKQLDIAEDNIDDAHENVKEAAENIKDVKAVLI
jgi:flagellin-like hook-associated protein FlgL